MSCVYDEYRGFESLSLRKLQLFSVRIIALILTKWGFMAQNILVEAALNARKRAYAPYSSFHVGAALETSDGKIYEGCNVENASYSLTQCAERTALFTAVAAGERHFKHLAIASKSGVSPCGACRQVIWELCGDIPITIVDEQGNTELTSSSKLLPAAFNKQNLII